MNTDEYQKKINLLKKKFFALKVKNPCTPNSFVQGHVLFKCQNCEIPCGRIQQKIYFEFIFILL